MNSQHRVACRTRMYWNRTRFVHWKTVGYMRGSRACVEACPTVVAGPPWWFVADARPMECAVAAPPVGHRRWSTSAFGIARPCSRACLEHSRRHIAPVHRFRLQADSQVVRRSGRSAPRWPVWIAVVCHPGETVETLRTNSGFVGAGTAARCTRL